MLQCQLIFVSKRGSWGLLIGTKQNIFYVIDDHIQEF